MEAKVYHASQVDRIIIINGNRDVFHLLLKIDGDGVRWLEFLYVPLTIIADQPGMFPRNMQVFNDNVVC